MSNYFDDITDVIWEGINKCYDITDTDIIVDGSHIPMNGKKVKKMATVAVENLYTARKRPRRSDFLIVKKNPYVDVDVRISVQKVLDPFSEDDNMKAVDELTGDRCSFFKLESSFPMDPLTVLEVYRSRIAVEHLISSIKSVVKLKPLRV